MENIKLPLKRGKMEDIDLGEPSSSQPEDDSTAMEVEGSSSQVRPLYYINNITYIT
jgi:hypothetical protein